MKLFFTQQLPTPHFMTQAELVLGVLQHRGATATDVFRDLGIKSPSAVIHRLEKAGYPIKTRRVRKLNADYDKYIFQAEYRLQYEGITTLTVDYKMEGM